MTQERKRNWLTTTANNEQVSLMYSLVFSSFRPCCSLNASIWSCITFLWLKFNGFPRGAEPNSVQTISISHFCFVFQKKIISLIFEDFFFWTTKNQITDLILVLPSYRRESETESKPLICTLKLTIIRIFEPRKIKSFTRRPKKLSPFLLV